MRPFAKTLIGKTIRENRGITLIEVLSAMIILAVGLLALAPMMVLSIDSNGRADDLTLATMLAQTTLETYKQLDSLPVVPYETITLDSTSGLTNHVRLDNSLSDAAVPTGMNRIGVTVSWDDQAGVARQIEYSTLVAQ